MPLISGIEERQVRELGRLLASKEARREFVLRLKEAGLCTDCQKSYAGYAMEYDHIGDKAMNVSMMIGKCYSMDSIVDEILKCELVCVLCHRDRTYNRLQTNPRSRKDGPANRASHDRWIRMRDFVYELKRNPCTDCGKTFNPWQMDFDHRPGEIKVAGIAVLCNGSSTQRILDEVKKCDLLCVLCHKHRTAKSGFGSNSAALKPEITGNEGRAEWRQRFTLKPEEKEQIVKDYQSGQSSLDLAKKFDIGTTSVIQTVKKAGLQPRDAKQAAAKRKVFTDEEQKQLIEMYQSGKTMKQIGQVFGRPASSIHNYLKSNNIQSRQCATQIRDSNGRIYDSVKQAASELGLSQGNISMVLSGRRNHTGGLTFEYISGTWPAKRAEPIK